MGGATVSFLEMKHGTREDYLLLDQSERDFARGLPDRLLAALGKLDHSLAGYKVSRLEHSLQTASRAERAGADEELVAAALLHDLGDELAPYNHAEIAAGILRPYVRAEVTWIVEQHGLFQAYYYAIIWAAIAICATGNRAPSWYEACAGFCENWDQASFDPAYPTLPLGHFEPLVQRIFSRAAHDPRYVAPPA